MQGYKCVEDRICIQNSHCCERRPTKHWWSGLLDAGPQDLTDERKKEFMTGMGHFFDRDLWDISDQLDLESNPITFAGTIDEDDLSQDLIGYPNIDEIDLNNEGACKIGMFFIVFLFFVFILHLFYLHFT